MVKSQPYHTCCPSAAGSSRCLTLRIKPHGEAYDSICIAVSLSVEGGNSKYLLSYVILGCLFWTAFRV